MIKKNNWIILAVLDESFALLSCYCDRETVSDLLIHRRKVWILCGGVNLCGRILIPLMEFSSSGVSMLMEKCKEGYCLLFCMLCLGLFGWLGIIVSSMILCLIDEIAFML
jgi:hypothetical protein